MKIKHIVIREYAKLTIDAIEATLDQAQVSRSAFDWLCQWQARLMPSGAELIQIENRKSLRFKNYVGVVQTPCGTLIEILPKHISSTSGDELSSARQVLFKMLISALSLARTSTDFVSLKTAKLSLPEWLMSHFISQLETLVKQRLNFTYNSQHAVRPYLRGKLNIAQHLLRTPAQGHLFHIIHDEFEVNRPENRLLMSALLRVVKTTVNPDTWRKAQELHHRMVNIPPSVNMSQDFDRWQHNRLMHKYQAILPWCRLLLGKAMPLATYGDTMGLCVLFPMEKLFESYVAQKLLYQLSKDYELITQSRQKNLCIYGDRSLFQLRPDLLIRRRTDDKDCLVLDTKWKRIRKESGGNFGISQSDLYQMFAYGHKYLNNQGDLVLIYPKTEDFQSPFSLPFIFSESMRLWVLPFDLENDRLISPKEGPINSCDEGVIIR